jgi:formylglycine-generating enzyme required for sulfatase activity/serine/threonine protein kinase
MTGFACPSCGRQLKIKPGQAGKRARCPQCQETVQVPDLSGTSDSLVDAATVLPAQDSAARSVGGNRVTGVPSGPSLPPEEKPEGELLRLLSPAEGPGEMGRLGGYRVLRVLGAGGMGAVLQAEDPLLKRQLALKVMLPALAAFESHRQRFLLEAQAAAAIAHDHVVAIFQVGEANGIPFLAMPLLQGESLEAAVRRKGRLSLADKVRIGRETAEGLAAAHERGLIHRDIKPANIWLEALPARADGEESPMFRVKILDFGLARSTRGSKGLTQSGAVLGTPGYMAPEQASGQAVDGRCDLFSLGCVLYRLLTGRPAFAGDDILAALMAVATETPPAPAEVSSDVPRRLSALVMQMLEKAPGDRPASAAAVAAALAELERAGLAEEGIEPDATPQVKERVTTPVELPPEPALRVRRRKKERKEAAGRVGWVLAGGGCLAVLLAVAVAFVVGRSGRGTQPDTVAAAPVVEPSKPEASPPPPPPDEVKPPVVPEKKDPPPGKEKDVVPPAPPPPVVPREETREVEPAPVKLPELQNGIGMKLVRIPAGTFWMGSIKKGGARYDNECPRHEVEISRPFGLGMHEVTQKQYQIVMKKNPSWFSATGGGKTSVQGLDTSDFPVESVSWDDAVAFCKKLSGLPAERKAGRTYRLPTEAEWEYACRAGTATAFHFGRFLSDRLANAGSALGRPCPVGSYPPNAWGLYDMHGNVAEWCADRFADNYYQKSPLRDPQGPAMGMRRVVRGGSFGVGDQRSRSGYRARRPSGQTAGGIGFRVAVDGMEK